MTLRVDWALNINKQPTNLLCMLEWNYSPKLPQIGMLVNCWIVILNVLTVTFHGQGQKDQGHKGVSSSQRTFVCPFVV